MDETNLTTNEPVIKNQLIDISRFNPTAWSSRKKILALVVCLLLPPFGVLAIVYLLTKVIRKPDWRAKRVLLWIAITLVVSSGGTYGYFQLNNYWFANRHYNYSYSELDDFKLTSNLEGTAISFKKPTEYTQAGKSEVLLGSSSAYFIQRNYQTKPVTSMGYLSVSLVQSALATSHSYIESLTKTLNNPVDPDYEAIIKPIKDLTGETSSNNKVVLAAAKPLTTDNLKDNAWQFDFSVRNDEKGVKVTPLKGKIIFAIGKNTFYYLTISTLDYNWDKSQTTWQQVLDSIKIDQ